MNRSTLRASCSLPPIAVTTCEGSATPAWQADPVDAATPSDIEEEQQTLPHGAGEQEVRIAGQPVHRIAQQSGGRNRRADAGDEPIAQTLQARVLALPLGLCGLECGGEGRGSRHVLGAGPQSALLSSAVQQRGHLRRTSDDERSHTDRRADLVSGEAHGDQTGSGRSIPAQLAERQRHVPESGHGIEVQRHSGAGCGRGQRTGIVQGPHLVVRHQRGRQRSARQGIGERLRRDASRLCEGHCPHHGTVRGECRDRVHGRVVLAVRQQDGIGARRAHLP